MGELARERSAEMAAVRRQCRETRRSGHARAGLGVRDDVIPSSVDPELMPPSKLAPHWLKITSPYQQLAVRCEVDGVVPLEVCGPVSSLSVLPK